MFRLGIDYGTSSTVAVLAWPDGRRRPLLFDGSPLLPSAVFAEVDGRLLTGRDALRAARIDPARLEPNPKRRLTDGEVLLGDTPIAVTALIAATLGTVWREAIRTAGLAPAAVVLTVPAAWGQTRHMLLLQAAHDAGMPQPSLMAEPVAAARYFTAVGQHAVGLGQNVVVYDLGAGTFDVAVVRRTAEGFETRASGGLEAIGGLDLDTIVVSLLGTGLARSEDQPIWRRLTQPASPADQRACHELWEAAREARETLSRHPSAAVRVPLIERATQVTREQFEEAAAPLLRQTVEVTLEAARSARVPVAQLAGVFLVGGSTRTPLVATLLHRATTVAPIVLEQPELVVAEGALLGQAEGSRPGPVSAWQHSGPVSADQASAGQASADQDGRPLATRRRQALLALAIVCALGLGGGSIYAATRGTPGPAQNLTHQSSRARTSGIDGAGGTPSPSGSAASAASAAPVAPAGSSTRPVATGPSITLDPASGRAGTSFTVTGRGFPPGCQIEVRFHATEVATETSGADGTFTTTAVVPQDMRQFAGSWQVIATERCTIQSARASFTISS
ncbi:MAG: Hsp70 family protein [Micromonosporaceae bacterium]|nr:Hsp70 family protein [Micromonosporaceae bacterium]